MMPLALRLTLIDLLGLALDGEILVDDSYPPFLCQGDGHLALGHGIHGRAEQGDIEANPPRKLGGDVNIRRQDLAVAGFEENVVEGQAEVSDYFFAHRRAILSRVAQWAGSEGIGYYAAARGKKKGWEAGELVWFVAATWLFTFHSDLSRL